MNGSTASLASGPRAEQRTVGPIRGAIGDCHATAQQLSATIDRLETTLDPVLAGSHPPSGPTAVQDRGEAASALHDTILDHESTLASLRRRLDAIIDRITL